MTRMTALTVYENNRHFCHSRHFSEERYPRHYKKEKSQSLTSIDFVLPWGKQKSAVITERGISPVTPMKGEKNLMRTRDKSINIRVTNGEKKRLEAKAKRYGMSISTYLRMSGLDKNIKPKPSENLYQAYRNLREMRRNFSSIDPARLDDYFAEIEEKILEAYYESDGESDGSDEDLEH